MADRIHSAAIRLLRRVRREDAAAGIGPAQLSALGVLVFGGPLGVGALAEAEQVSLPTMSKIVRALAAAGLVERMPSERDRRSVTIHPTEAGRELMRAGRARRVERLAGQLDGLAEDDLRTLDRAAAILARLQQSA